MKTVLILNPTYLPGFRAGGPQQTVKNICDVYGNRSNIFIITQNRDYGSKEPYDLPTNKWISSNRVKVKYLEPSRYGLSEFIKAYIEFDTIYSCGLFCKNSYETMLIHKLLHRQGKKIYVAPMGVFSKGAMEIKPKKKKLFIQICKIFGIFDGITWSFTSLDELEDAERIIGKEIKSYIIAEDLPRKVEYGKIEKSKKKKKEGNLDIVFLSRISPMKNLEQCFDVLSAEYKGRIKFDIYGSKEDVKYWKECMKKAKELPSNIDVHYRGEVEPEEVIPVFSSYDVFLFPTKGENYGHVIFEALASGCLPIISDKTPWADFGRRKCGSICALDNLEEFRSAVSEYLEMDEISFSAMRENAKEYANEKYDLSVRNSGYRSVFIDGAE